MIGQHGRVLCFMLMLLFMVSLIQTQDSVTSIPSAMTNASCNHTAEFWCNTTCLLKTEACDVFAVANCPRQKAVECRTCPPDTHHCDFHVFACLPGENICDGISDCRKGDDEFHCETRRCPDDCTCFMNATKVMDVTNGYQEEVQMMTTTCINGWNETTFERIAKTTDYLWLRNGSIGTLDRGYFKAFYHPLAIAIGRNDITELVRRSFEGSYYITWLDISDNKVREIVNGVFETLTRLEKLIMYNVPIKWLRSGAFFGLNRLKTLVMVRPRRHRKWRIRVEDKAFDGMNQLNTVYLDDPILCCYFKDVKNCISVTGPQPPLLMCASLFDALWIRIIAWVFGIIAILGNALLILAKSFGEPENETWKVHKFLEANVAASKIFMGMFLCILVRGDMWYGPDYVYQQYEWQKSASCKLAGLFALISCESFVFLYAFISFVHIKRLTEPLPFPFVGIVTAAIWGVALVLGLFGLMGNSDSNFYDRTNHCIGLPLVRRPSDVVPVNNSDILSSQFYNRSITMTVARGTQSAWGYSVFLWFIINLPLIIAGSVLHFKSFLITYKLANLKPDETGMMENTEEKELEELENQDEQEIRITGTGPRLGFVFWVDCLTWSGLIAMCFLGQVGAIEVTVNMYSWATVVVLGFGSFLCPIVFVFAFLCTGEYEEDPPDWYEERLQEMLRQEEEERLREEEEERKRQEEEEKKRLEEGGIEIGEHNEGFDGVDVEGGSKNEEGNSAGDSGVVEAAAASGEDSASFKQSDSIHDVMAGNI